MRPLRAHLVANHGLAGVARVTLQERNELWALRDHRVVASPADAED